MGEGTCFSIKIKSHTLADVVGMLHSSSPSYDLQENMSLGNEIPYLLEKYT